MTMPLTMLPTVEAPELTCRSGSVKAVVATLAPPLTFPLTHPLAVLSMNLLLIHSPAARRLIPTAMAIAPLIGSLQLKQQPHSLCAKLSPLPLTMWTLRALHGVLVLKRTLLGPVVRRSAMLNASLPLPLSPLSPDAVQSELLVSPSDRLPMVVPSLLLTARLWLPLSVLVSLLPKLQSLQMSPPEAVRQHGPA